MRSSNPAIVVAPKIKNINIRFHHFYIKRAILYNNEVAKDRENTPRSLMTCFDKFWVFFLSQNATSEIRIKIGFGDRRLRYVRIKIDAESWVRTYHYQVPR